jgi:hypothetical protein
VGDGLSGVPRVLAADGPAIREKAIDRFGAIANRSAADAGSELFKEWKLPCLLELEKRAAGHG